MTLYALGDLKPTVPASGDYWIAPSAQVTGDVRIGADCSVWFNAVIRGDNEPVTLGKGVNIQDGSVLHSDPGFPLSFGEFVTVGHSAIVHGATIGNGVLIGMGATILNGAVIGDGSLVGANALVTEGKEFPPGSLIVGSPARAVRQLTPEQVTASAETAHRYVINYKRFKSDLKIMDEPNA